MRRAVSLQLCEGISPRLSFTIARSEIPRSVGKQSRFFRDRDCFAPLAMTTFPHP